MAVTLRKPSEASSVFSIHQQKALSEFFVKYQIVVEDWNKLSEEDPTWNLCISALEKHYQRSSRGSSAVAKYINDTVQEWSRQIRLVKQIKFVFIQHVIISGEQLLTNAKQFVSNIQMNQFARYTCLIPSNRDFIINYKFTSRGLTDASLNPDLISVWDVDLWLSKNLETEHADRYGKLPKKLTSVMDTMPMSGNKSHIISEQVLVLTKQLEALENSLQKLPKTFQDQQRTDIMKSESVRQNSRYFSLIVLCLTISTLFFLIVSTQKDS